MWTLDLSCGPFCGKDMGYNIVELIELIFEGASFFYVIFVQTFVLPF